MKEERDPTTLFSDKGASKEPAMPLTSDLAISPTRVTGYWRGQGQRQAQPSPGEAA